MGQSEARRNPDYSFADVDHVKLSTFLQAAFHCPRPRNKFVPSCRPNQCKGVMAKHAELVPGSGEEQNLDNNFYKKEQDD